MDRLAQFPINGTKQPIGDYLIGRMKTKDEPGRWES